MRSRERGFIMLMAVIVVSALGTAVALSLLSLAGAASQAASAIERGAQMRALVDSCAEAALLKATTMCTADTQTLTIGEGTCAYIMTAQDGNRALQVEGTYRNAVRRMKATVTFAEATTPVVVWQEVAAF